MLVFCYTCNIVKNVAVKVQQGHDKPTRKVDFNQVLTTASYYCQPFSSIALKDILRTKIKE